MSLLPSSALFVRSSGDSYFCSFWFYHLTRLSSSLPPLAALGDPIPLQAWLYLQSHALPPGSRQPPNSQLSGRAEGPDVIQTEDAQNFTACTCICPEPASGGHPSLFFPLTLHVHPPPSAAVAASQRPITRAHALRLLAPVVAHVTIPPPLGGRHVQGSDPTTSGLFLCMAARTMFLRYLFSFS